MSLANGKTVQLYYDWMDSNCFLDPGCSNYHEPHNASCPIYEKIEKGLFSENGDPLSISAILNSDCPYRVIGNLPRKMSNVVISDNDISEILKIYSEYGSYRAVVILLNMNEKIVVETIRKFQKTKLRGTSGKK